jgi:hypothetical protein
MARTNSKQDALIDELLQDCPDPTGQKRAAQATYQAAGRTNPAIQAYRAIYTPRLCRLILLSLFRRKMMLRIFLSGKPVFA